MSLIKLKPTTPSRRFAIKVKNKNLQKNNPYKKLIKVKNRINGRNNKGKITVRHRGGSSYRKKYRIIDFKRDKDNIVGIVKTLEYDPNRNAYISLISYADGEYRYIISPKNIHINQKILSGSKCPIKVGNTLPLNEIPEGTIIHCIELTPGKGAILSRSAGSYAQLLSKEDSYAIIKLKSGEIRKILLSCKATIGTVSNEKFNLTSYGKAGAKRWRGIRPTVRGVAMNPIDHPHGGGEGRSSGGRHPVSPQGKHTKGAKTRKKNKLSNKFIISSKKKKRR